MKNFLFLGSLYGFFGVAFGAFGAHALKDKLQALGTLEIYKTGVQYHLVHAVALILIALLYDRLKDRVKVNASGGLFAAGILIFSGSLYLYAISKTAIWALITPLGGLCFLAGWALLAAAAMRE